ncbi:MAG: DUF3887 domain-containing protein [Lachnospiraceae bacterium]|nr:DUF3887 domain-containing protein [Lachnospiraceae bacterium]
MKQDVYVKSIVRRLKCSGKQKKEIRKEMESDIQTALERGESWEQIEKRIGTPAAAAAEFNENFSEEELKLAKRNRRLKIAAVIAAILAAVVILVWQLIPKSFSLNEQDGGFSKEQIVKQAEQVVHLLDADDFDALRAMSTKRLQQSMTKEILESARQQIGSDWGKFQSFGSVYTGGIDQMGNRIAVVQLVAVYEKKSVTYTISFEEDGKLSGLYMK